MKKTVYILKYMGNGVAVILLNKEDNKEELKTKLSEAIKTEVNADADTQFSLKIGILGDWGEDTDITTSYVTDGSLVEDNEFNIMKTVSY